MFLTRYSLLFCIIACCLLSECIHASPQRNDVDVDKQIQDVFGNNGSSRSRDRSGFATVVTPEPIDPSRPQPVFTSISGKSQCNCVPYHMCSTGPNTSDNEETFDGTGSIDIRVGGVDDLQPSCDHFLDVCCDTNQTRNESLNPSPVVNQPAQPVGCGVRNTRGIDFTITGANDNEANFGEFPWTVALLHASNFSYFCAGSLIHPRVVLTAAHCIVNRPASSFLVRAGEWDTQTTKERLPYEEQQVQRIIIHSQFNPGNVAYDFALLMLGNAFNMDEHINIVCLPQQNAVSTPGTTCYSTGWGKDVFGELGRFSAIMKRVPLPIVDFNSCQTQLRGTRLGPKFALDRSFICAGGVRGVDTCQGDGGAPLACPASGLFGGNDRYVQSGIVAWGIGCNDGLPAAYANVALVRDWIDQQMLSNGLPTTGYTAI